MESDQSAHRGRDWLLHQTDTRTSTGSQMMMTAGETEDEPEDFLDYRLQISNHMGLTLDMIFRLAQVVSQVVIETQIGDALSPSQEDLLSIVAGTRPLILVAGTDEAPPQLQRHTMQEFDVDPQTTETSLNTDANESVLDLGEVHDMEGVDSWDEFVSSALNAQRSSSTDGDSGATSSDESQWWESSEGSRTRSRVYTVSATSGTGYLADHESMDQMDRISQLSESDFTRRRRRHTLDRMHRSLAVPPEDQYYPRTLADVRGQLALELLGPVRRPLRTHSVPGRLAPLTVVDVDVPPGRYGQVPQISGHQRSLSSSQTQHQLL
ncbi:hypothetical protein BV898_08928 [Hypsibius exemplaris]|uniref:Uncharacterized protein n=1 Tax=Hypsibius exemplaris TaxID=2072580 RepID=A0A1W0WP14_HYPEX|nr:hypothetical protein BV898_08928 [Hypsibius exemplaris]